MAKNLTYLFGKLSWLYRVRFQAHWSPSLILLKMAKCNPIEETSGIKKNNSLHFRADKTTVSKYLGKITQSMTTSKGKLDQS